MYRPTVRYDSVFKGYVESIYNATTLDRNQIIRAALFIAGHTEQFSKIMQPYLKNGVSLPKPNWPMDLHELWLNQKLDNSIPKQSNAVTHETNTINENKHQNKTIEEPIIPASKPFISRPNVSIKFNNKEIRRHSPPFLVKQGQRD